MRDKAGTGEDEGEALMKLGFTKVEGKRFPEEECVFGDVIFVV